MTVTTPVALDEPTAPVAPVAPISAPEKPAAPEAPVAPAVAPPRPKPVNEYAHEYETFVEETKDHVLTVIMSDGLSRRMRVATPGTGMWAWNVITWPGYLATYGDIADGFMFSRDTDMMDFFDRAGHGAYYSDGAPSIDFRYWAEKLSGGRYNDVLEFSSKAFMQHVKDVLSEHEDMGDEAEAEHQKIVEVAKRVCARHSVDYDEYLAGLRENDRGRDLEIDKVADDEVEYFGMAIPSPSPAESRAKIIEEAEDYAGNQEEAYEFLKANPEIFGEDWWEARLTDFNIHFLFSCWAIELTVRLWREYEKSNDAKALALATQKTDRGMIDLARKRVDEDFKITGHGEVGELANGALLLRLADSLSTQISARPAYVPQAAPEEVPGDSYVLVDGGQVSNDPSLQVFDLDVLDSAAPTPESAAKVLAFYKRLRAHPEAGADLGDDLDRAAEIIRDHGTVEDIATLEALEEARPAA